MPTPDVSVVVLAHGDEPLLGECVASVLASRALDGQPLDLDVVVVDNGASGAISRLPSDPRVRVLTMKGNAGYAGGCNAGAAEARGDVLAFLNSDALVEPEAVAALADAVRAPAGGLACGSLRLLQAPETVNSVGNPVHFLGLAWSGGYGEPAAQHAQPRKVAAVSGAFFAARADTWRRLGGFDERYFAYHEDVELSLRCWQLGLEVTYEPSAVALHDYDLSARPSKRYLLERNRWQTVLTVYPATVLLAALPALLVFEVAVLVLASLQGWLRQKLQGYVWLLGHRTALRTRRAHVQGQSSLPAAEFAELLCADVPPSALGDLPGLAVMGFLCRAYWAVARRILVAAR